MQGMMQVPVLVYSGLAKERVAQLVKESEDLLFVPKPGTPEDLLTAVRYLLRGH
jgi:hypothetical protein